MSRLEYSTDLEELAFGKDAECLQNAADHRARPGDRRDEALFEAGRHFHASQNVWYFTLWEDGTTLLFFQGEYKDVLRRLRRVRDREEV